MEMLSFDRRHLPLGIPWLLVVLVGWPATVSANVGAATGQTLLQPLAARPAALGEAFAGVGGHLDSLGYNPAGLGTLGRTELAAMYHAGFAGDTFVSMLVGAPIRRVGVALGVAYYTAGTVERLDLVGGGEVIRSEVSAQRDLLVNVGAGYRLSRIPLSVGFSGKVLRTELIEEVSAVAFAGDLGAQADIPGVGLALGAAVQHVGSRLKLNALNEADLPLLLRFGLAYEISLNRAGSRFGTMKSLDRPRREAASPPHHLLTLVEYVTRIEESARGLAAGIEYGYARVVAVRAGFRSLTHGAAARYNVYTVGLGVRLPVIRLDYAVELLPFTSLHRLGLTATP